MNTESNKDHQRIVEMEMSLTHLQRDFDALNGVVLEQQAAIEAISAQMLQLKSKLDASSDPEVRDAESERPPHY